MSIVFPKSPANIPEEVILQIFSYVHNLSPHKDPRIVSAVSNDWNRIFNDTSYWGKTFYSMMETKFNSNGESFKNDCQKWIGKITPFFMKKDYPSQDILNTNQRALTEEIEKAQTNFQKLSQVTFQKEKHEFQRYRMVIKRNSFYLNPNLNQEPEKKLLSAQYNIPLQYEIMHDFNNLPILKDGLWIDWCDYRHKKHSKDPSREEIDNFFLALENGSFKVPPSTTRPKILGKLLLFAVFSNDLEHLELVLEKMEKKPQTIYKELGEALLFASWRNYHEIVRAILAHPKLLAQIPLTGDNSLGRSFNEAASIGNVETLEVFLAFPNVMEMVPITKMDGVGDAISSTACHGHCKAFSMILYFKNFLELIPEGGFYCLASAFHDACAQGHLEMIKLMLSDPKIVAKIPGIGCPSFADAVNFANRELRSKIIDEIYSHKEISEKILKEGNEKVYKRY